MKKSVFVKCVLLAIIFVAGITGCTKESAEAGTAKSESGADAVKAKEIIIADSSEDGSLDPAGLAIQTWVSYSKLCSSPLLSYDEKGSEVLEAAESYSVSDDQLTWTFKLREDGKWSDGSPVTAADFINTIYRALDPANSYSIYANQLYIITGAEEANRNGGSLENVGVKALDDFTLEFSFNSPCTYFKKMLSLPIFYPTKEGVATADDPNWFRNPDTNLSNGAFKLSEYVQDQYYVVEKNPYYINADKVSLDKITMRFINDSQAQIAAYESGEVDCVNGLPDYIKVKYEDSDELTIWHMLTTTAILPNVTVKPLDDVRVRKAIAIALERGAISKTMGSDVEPSYSWVPKYMQSNSGSKYFSEESGPLFSEDIKEAKALLAEAGYPDGAGFPKLTYIYPSNDTDSVLAQAIQAQLKANLGINIDLQAQEYQVYNATKRDGNFDFLRFGWTADFNDPINYLSLYDSSSPLNFGKVKDVTYDAAIKASNTEADPTARNKSLHKAAEILITDNFYTVPLVTKQYIGLRNTAITGISYNDKGEPYYRFADLN